MLGAIIGDVAGSKYEFSNIRTDKFELLTKGCSFTDDTVCTIANMDWILHGDKNDPKSATKFLRKWTRKYPYAGYGGRFFSWVHSDNPAPYGSYGNGAAMRISPVAWAASDLKDLKKLSDTFTGITHNHPLGMKGALVVATCIYMALHGSSKQAIKTYALEQYPEINGFCYEDLKKTYRFDETCQGSVPQAIYCFLISNDYEDCIRKTISIGGDCDTTSAMSGGIAEAFYGIPNSLINKVKTLLDSEMIEVIDEFYSTYTNK